MKKIIYILHELHSDKFMRQCIRVSLDCSLKAKRKKWNNNFKHKIINNKEDNNKNVKVMDSWGIEYNNDEKKIK